MAVTKQTVYMKGNKNTEVTKREVLLGDILMMECSDPTIVPKLRALKILNIPDQGQHRYVVSVLHIIACIHEKYPMLDIQNMGEMDLIVTYEEQKEHNALFQAIKVAGVVLITFTGSAFSIMSFHNDVSTTKMFSQVYEWLTGNASSGFTILEVSYSIGLVIGILVFFNHFGKKRFTVDPTPIEVEMRLYENDIQTTLIDEYERKGKEMDVDQTGNRSNHRT
ncbi:MAG: stage V sporulation protein AA [Hespellia sp.]|nr:stage V sporulation protein AA [Hespellia sp.]